MHAPHKLQFSEARIKLTLWYALILGLILAAFSVLLYFSQLRDFRNVVVTRNIGIRIHREINEVEYGVANEQLQELKNHLITNILLADIVILTLGSLVAYFFAGLSLAPLEKSYESQKQFVADASHELKTPITAIKLASEVALRAKHLEKNKLTNVIKQNLGQADKLHKIVQDLFMIAQFEMPNTHADFKKVNFSEIVQNALEQIQPIATQKGITLTTDIEANIYQKGDPHTLHRLCIILLDNAIKYSPSGKNIEVTLSVVDNRNQFCVQDYGIGIENSEQSKIFERFYRSPNATEKSEGTGLGLAIAQEIINEHHARIEVESQVDTGTTVKIIF